MLPKQTALLDLLATSPNLKHRSLVKYCEKTGGLFQLDQGQLPQWAIDHLDNEGGAFMAFREFDLTNRVFGREIFFDVQVGIMINSARLWRQDFDDTIMYLNAYGIIDKWKKDFNENKKSFGALSVSQLPASPLSISHIASSLMMLFIGLVASTIVFGLELYYIKHKTVFC